MLASVSPGGSGRYAGISTPVSETGIDIVSHS
ncbi:unnamed protein product, partial [marine sediment metagenome]